MAYDEDLADRVRVAIHAATDGGDGVTEKRMFGGLAFLVNGNMSVTASGHGGVLLRVDPSETETFVAQEHVDRMVMRGRAMDGWLRVGEEATATDEDLQRWVDVGVARARALPAK
jgi:TfoX/Sxy family transcriptional regulator of competence genes